MHPSKDKITVVIIFLSSCLAPSSALDYNDRCEMVPDLCDANKFLQCGPRGYCECHNAPEAFYDTAEGICKLKSGARCSRLGTKHQPCVNDAYCPEAPDAVCTCMGDFVPNRDRNCFLPHASRCSIVDQKCDPSGFLQCGPNSICECQQRGESWYNDNTKTCHLLTGAGCLLPPDQMQCVPNAECDLNTRKCRCFPGLDETTDRMCYLGYQMDCQPFQDMCNFNGFMQCDPTYRKCMCRPEYEALYDNSSKVCRLVHDAGCSTMPLAQPCITNAQCVAEPGSEPYKCKCQYNLEPNKNRECYRMAGQPCDEFHRCDPAGYLTCGMRSICECTDGNTWYDPVAKECRFYLNSTCSTDGGVQQCGRNAFCDRGVCRCLPLYENAGNGDCLRSYGSPCTPGLDDCNSMNMLQCVNGQCLCYSNYLESRSGYGGYDVACLPGYQQSCTEDIFGPPCAPEAQLICIAGRCNCLSPGEQQYIGQSRRCATLAGNRCRPNYGNISNPCVDNAYCDARSSDIYGICRCELGFMIGLNGLCRSSAVALQTTLLVLAVNMFVIKALVS